jgi:hypothetical protein
VAHESGTIITSGSPANIRVAPDLLFPRTIDVTEVGAPSAPYDIELFATWDDERLGYSIRRLSVERKNEPITGAGIRSIAVQELFQSGVAMSAELADGTVIEHLGRDLGDRLEGASDEERLLWAARIYAIARAYGTPPLKTVSEVLRISQSTATRMVARAREAHLLD